MRLTSTAFEEGGEIPFVHTSNGHNSSPHLKWSEVPQTAQSLVLALEDLDALPEPWVHWLVFNIPPTTTEALADKPPAGGTLGLSNGGTYPYEGPWSKYFAGVHHYAFELYALDTHLNVPADSDMAAIRKAMEGHVIEKAELPAVSS